MPVSWECIHNDSKHSHLLSASCTPPHWAGHWGCCDEQGRASICPYGSYTPVWILISNQQVRHKTVVSISVGEAHMEGHRHEQPETWSTLVSQRNPRPPQTGRTDGMCKSLEAGDGGNEGKCESWLCHCLVNGWRP